MRKKSLQSILITGLMFCFGFSGLSVGAQTESEANKDILITIQTEKASYEKEDIIEYKINVKNTGMFTSKDLVITNELPENMTILETDGEIQENKIVWNKDLLKRDEAAIYTIKAKVEEKEAETEEDKTEAVIPPANDESSNGNGTKIEETPSVEKAPSDIITIIEEGSLDKIDVDSVKAELLSKAKSYGEKTIKTADKNTIISLGIFAFLSLVACILLRENSKGNNISLTLAVLMGVSLMSCDKITANAIDEYKIVESIEHIINVGEEKLVMKVNVKGVLVEGEANNFNNPNIDKENNDDKLDKAEDEE